MLVEPHSNIIADKQYIAKTFISADDFQLFPYNCYWYTCVY